MNRLNAIAPLATAAGLVLLLSSCGPAGTVPDASPAQPQQAASSAPASTILEAIRNDDAAQVAAFLAAGDDPNAEESGIPLLHVAATGDFANAAQALIDGGADVNVRAGSAGATPLIVASESDGTAVLQVLLAAGADVGLGEETGPAAGPMQAAARAGNVEALMVLKEHGLDADYKGAAKSTALIWAAYYGQLEAVEYLIAEGADLTEVDVAGQDALRNAEIGGFPEVADAIRAHMEAQGLA
jgi:ankyrin repeat protein